MKHHNNGFGAVEVFIVILVVGLLGFGGWYIWQSNNKEEEKKSNTTTAQQSEADTEPYADWKSYSKDDLTFSYPSDWVLAENGPGPQVKSGDYASTGVQSTTVTKGASISVSTPTAPQTAITAENYNTSSAWSPSYSNFKTITVNGKQAAQYNVSTDIINTALFNADGKMTTLQFQFAAADYDAMLAIYNHLLETVEIK